MSLLLLFQSANATPVVLGVEKADPTIVGQVIGLIRSGQETISGGYGFGAADRTLHLRKKRQELDEQEKKQLADRLEAVMLAEGSITQEKADLLRLRGLVAEHDYLPNKARRAVAYAERVKTAQALFLALREIERLQAEEELAVLLTLSLD